MEKMVEVLKFFDNHPFVFAIIYKEKILFINKAFKEKLGFSDEEIKNMTIFDLIKNPEDKEYIIKNVTERIKGKEFVTSYKNIQIINKRNERLYVAFFSQTVKFDNESVGVSIGFDATKEYKRELLIDILKQINHIIITKNKEREIFEGIAESIYKIGDYKFVVCAFRKENRLNIECHINTDEELIEYLNEIFVLDGTSKCFAKDNFLSNKLNIVNNLKEIENKNPELVEKLRKRGVNSYALIPIYKNKTLYAVIGIASEYINDFDKDCEKVYYEAKFDIEFALEKIEHYKYLEILKEAIDKSFAWVIITDENGKIIYANKTVEEISKYSLEELFGKNPKIFKSGFHGRDFYEKFWNKLLNNQMVEALIVNKDRYGNLFYLKDRVIPIVTKNGEKYYISLAIDVTTEYNLKRKLKKDILTNLPNRNEFILLAQKKIQENRDKKFACVVIDISDFKIYNQIYGNESGDFVLKEFAKFLTTFFYEEDIVARIGGDEFAVFFEIHNYDDVDKVVLNLIEKIKHSYDFNNKLAVNIGISLYPRDDSDIVKLLEKAIFALQIAKEKGDFTYEYFNKVYDKKIIEYYDVKHLILEAIEKKEFIYHFQPYVDAKTKEIVGAETLLRIKKEGEILYPNVFIDFLENSNYIKEVEKLMFPKFLEYLRKVNIPLSFNISGRSLTDMDHISELFDEVVDDRVIIELTEREIALNIEYTKKIFNFFKSKNFKLSIDDFGTGYSSLTYLKELPADFLKIDMGFIKNIEHSKKDLAIVETIITFAHKFGLKTIAEGVENEKQVEILKNIGCDYLQGFYFYKPMPFEELISLLK